MNIVEIGTGYTQIPARIGAATEIVAYNLFLSFNNIPQVRSEIVDITFDKNIAPEKNIRRVYIPEKYKAVNDKGALQGLRRLIYSWKLSFFLRKIVNNGPEEIILHFHNQFNFYFFYLLNKRLLNKGRVLTAFTVHSSHWSFAGKIPRNLLLEKFAIKKAHKVIAITKAIKENILLSETQPENAFANKIFCIHNGVNTQTYFPVEIQKQNRFINIGSVCSRKDQLGTIILLSDFLKKNNYDFVFAGKIIEPEYLRQIEEYVSKNDLSERVKYLGEIEPGHDLNLAYNQSKAYISSSKKEAGLSLVVLEALSAGLPVFLSHNFDVSLADFSSLPETIRLINHNSFYGDLQKIAQTDASRLKEMGAVSRQFVQDHLSWDAIAYEHYKAFISHKISMPA